MEIHDDIAYCIMSKLPLKSLKRFTCVHNSWAGLLQTPHFMNMFRANLLSQHRSHYHDASLLTAGNNGPHRRLHLVSGDNFDDDSVKFDWPLPIQNSYGGYDI